MHEEIKTGKDYPDVNQILNESWIDHENIRNLSEFHFKGYSEFTKHLFTNMHIYSDYLELAWFIALTILVIFLWGRNNHQGPAMLAMAKYTPVAQATCGIYEHKVVYFFIIIFLIDLVILISFLCILFYCCKYKWNKRSFACLSRDPEERYEATLRSSNSVRRLPLIQNNRRPQELFIETQPIARSDNYVTMNRVMVAPNTIHNPNTIYPQIRR